MQQVSKRGWLRAFALFAAIMMSFGIMGVRAKVALADVVIDKVEITGVTSPDESGNPFTAHATPYSGNRSDLPVDVTVKWLDGNIEVTTFESDKDYVALIEIPIEKFTHATKFSSNPTVTWDGETIISSIGTTSETLRAMKTYHTAPYTVKFINKGTEVSSIKIAYGENVIFPEITDSSFKGWFSELTGQKLFKTGDECKINNNATFYAEYGETRTLTFYSNYTITYADEVKTDTFKDG
jgi:hypothetical protein